MKKIDNRLFSPIVQYIENRPLFVLIMAILIIGFVVYWDFFTFQKFYLFKDIGSDSLNASYPYFVHLSHYLREWGFPGWSFNVGLGQNILPFSLGDPFNDILFILGADKVVYFVFYIEFIKILLSGILFYLFLSLFSLNPISCIISGLFYAF
ncbi:MAG: hypothetical protein ACE5D7_04435, partial [Fidelibacterota bacterium]